MALYQTAAGDRILAADINQYYNILKGVTGSGEAVTLIYNAAGSLILQPSSNPAAGTELLQIKNAAGTVLGAISSDGKHFAADGTAVVPGISFENDKDTGLYRIGANSFGFAVNGAIQATISATVFNVASGVKVQENGNSLNPMTTAGDLIYGGASGVPARLGIGTALQVLRTNAGATAPEWATLSSGTTLVTTIAEWTGDQATASATFVNITSATIATNTSGTNKCDYKLNLNCLNDTGGTANAFRIDISAGTRIQEAGWTCPAANYESPIIVEREYLDQATGAKTILGQMATNGGNLSSYNSLLSLGAHTAFLRHREYR